MLNQLFKEPMFAEAEEQDFKGKVTNAVALALTDVAGFSLLQSEFSPKLYEAFLKRLKVALDAPTPSQAKWDNKG